MMINYDTILKILANKNRREVIKLLSEKDMYQAEIGKLTHKNAATIRTTLQKLESMKIIKSYWKTVQTERGNPTQILPLENKPKPKRR